MANLGYGSTLRNANCRVLIYGDSTAMIGLNPAIIEQRTGLPTCNIAEFEGMTVLNGMMVVDRYLAQNPRPRFLVFLYSPEDFDPQSQRHAVAMTEAISWRLRQPDRLRGLAAVLHHPDEFFTWAGQGMRFAAQGILTAPSSVAVQNMRAVHRGQLPIVAPTMTKCESIVRPNSKPTSTWVSGLRSYERDGTTVLVDATPMPPCDPYLDYFRKHLSSLVDNGVSTLPLNLYTTDGRLHVNAAGSTVLSQMVADQISQRLSPTALPAER